MDRTIQNSEQLKLRSGLNMAKLNRSRDFNDKEAFEVVSQEINSFNKLIRGHEKLLEAIGKL